MKGTTVIAVIFEVHPTQAGMQEYQDIAGNLKAHLSSLPGFISIERFQSLADPGKLLSLSFWEDEASIENWRNFSDHRSAHKKGKEELFSEYRIRVGAVIRDYTIADRFAAPADSNKALFSSS